MKKLLGTLGLVPALFALAACGGSDDDSGIRG